MRTIRNTLLAMLILSGVYHAHAHEQRGLLDHAAEQVLGKNKLFLARHDIDMSLGGRVRQEGFYFDKPLTFREDYNDKYGFFRAKYNFDINTTYGRRTQGKVVVASGVRVTLFNAWNNFDVYTPVVGEPVSFSPQNFIKKAELDDHHHDGNVTLAFVEDAWMAMDMHRLFDANSTTPIELKMGYFKHHVGRGVSLGTFVDGGIKYLGWDSPGVVGNNTNSPPGIKLTIGDPDKLAFEFYYSKWRKRSHGPDFTRDETRAKRLDIINEDTREVQRGSFADRDLCTARFLYQTTFKDAQLNIEPYAVYVKAPELEVELEGDASARIATLGMMTEIKHGNWTFNAEFAAQFGHQDMHPIDRNHTVMDNDYYQEPTTLFDTDDDETAAGNPTQSIKPGRLDINMGHPRKYHSHVLIGMENTDSSGSEFLPYRAYFADSDTDFIQSDINRSLQAQGARIKAGYNPDEHIKPGTGAVSLDDERAWIAGEDFVATKFHWIDTNMYSGHKMQTGIEYYDSLIAAGIVGMNGSLYNADIPFGAGQRFRPGYRLECQGVMAMADLAYTSPDKQYKIGLAAAHISGGDYPLNKQENQTYKGFIPFKDQDYTGHSVESYAMLAARKIGRPTTFSDNLLHAPVNYDTMTNLQYVGVGGVWRPRQDRNELMVEGNALYFWQDCPPFTWDKNASRDFGSSKLNGIYSKAQADLGFTGHQTETRASKKLGLELNAVVAWRPIDCCELRFMVATFVPGQLYKDIEGTPSAYTIRRNKDGDLRFDSMGTKVPFGGMFRLTYWF